MPVYKYLVPQRVDVLEGRRMRFTQPGALNDLFEVKPYFDSFMTDDEWRETLAGEQMRLALENSLREKYDLFPAEHKALIPWPVFLEWAMKEFAATDIRNEVLGTVFAVMPEVVDSLRAGVDRVMQQIGILSLASRPDNVLMWSHYAQNNEGFLIEFGDAHPWFNRKASDDDDYNHLRRVTYEDSPDTPRAMSQVDAKKVLVVKGTVWAYEQEMRMLALLKDSDVTYGEGVNAIHLFNVPPSAMTGVYLGVRSGPELMEKIRDLLTTNADLGHLKLFRAKQEERSQRIVFDEIPLG